MRSSGERCIRRSVSRARSSGNTLRNGDCSSATASATFSAPSNTGSPVVFSKSARTIVSCSVSVRAPGRDERTTAQDDQAPLPAASDRTSAQSTPGSLAAPAGGGRRERRCDRATTDIGQDRGHLERRGRPIARIRRERLHDDPFELRIDVRDERRRAWRLARVPGSSERVPSDEQFVQHEAERVDVGPLRERRARRALFGRHVGRRAGQHVHVGVGPRDRDAEVGDAHQPVVVDEHVGRLEIAMEHALRVRRREAGAELAADVDDLFRRQPADAPEQRGQVLAANQLHRVEDRRPRLRRRRTRGRPPDA